MSDDATKKPDIKLVDTAPEDVFNDIEALRKTAVLKVSRKVVLTNVPVKKPAKDVYFRVHPNPEWSLNCSVIVGDGGSDDFYFVTPFMLNHHTMLPRLRRVTIATVYTWPGGAISLWPVPRIEETKIACWRSARAAFDLAKTTWVQLVWNGDTFDYDVGTAEGINNEPQWPVDKSFQDLLRLGFADKIIDRPEHPYVLRLRGLTE
jgi:hypothetical protein